MKENKIGKVNYYTMSTEFLSVDHEYLLEHDEVYALQRNMKKFLKNTLTEGRLEIESKEIKLIAELEDEFEHYSEEEIDESLKKSIPQEFDNMGRLYMASNDLLCALEQSGVTGFKAHPIHLTHKATQRVWENYWYLVFTYEQYIPLLTGKDLCFTDKDLSGVYFAESVMKHLKKSNIKNISFDKYEFPLCQSVPMSTIDHISDHVIKGLEQLFIHKTPIATKDSAYSIDYFSRKLQEKYSDITPTQIIEFIVGDKTKTFEIVKKEFIQIKSDSSLYQKMYN